MFSRPGDPPQPPRTKVSPYIPPLVRGARGVKGGEYIQSPLLFWEPVAGTQGRTGAGGNLRLRKSVFPQIEQLVWMRGGIQDLCKRSNDLTLENLIPKANYPVFRCEETAIQLTILRMLLTILLNKKHNEARSLEFNKNSI